MTTIRLFLLAFTLAVASYLSTCVVAVETGKTQITHRLAPSNYWKVGDSWSFQCEMYDPYAQVVHKRYTSGSPVPIAQNVVVARVTADEKVEEVSCWKITFMPAPPIHKFYKDVGYVAWISKNDGTARKIEHISDESLSPTLSDFGSLRILVRSNGDVPLVFLPINRLRKLVVKPKKSRMRFSIDSREDQKDKGVKIVEAKFDWVEKNEENPQEESRVQQVWREGATWWSSYEEYYQGRLALRARLLPSVSAVKKQKTLSRTSAH